MAINTLEFFHSTESYNYFLSLFAIIFVKIVCLHNLETNLIMSFTLFELLSRPLTGYEIEIFVAIISANHCTARSYVTINDPPAALLLAHW